MKTSEIIRKQVTENPVIIYMKGTPQMPQCGFSGNAVNALNSTGLPYAYINVLENDRIFQALPEYADWPTFPQIYIGGELVGGGDNVMEMVKDGSLKPAMEKAITASEQQKVAAE
ncbi:MAG: glutaredoxin [Gammaproteobacteria bacterium SG8_11]|nr:MAG: glutaredoxin [Gammaproteobacteria bacterium SG8_11]